MTNRYLPPRFFSQVHRHLWLTFSESATRGPLFAVVGPPGEGKTWQLEESLRQCNTEALHIFAGDMESFDAARPTDHLVETLQRAAVARSGGVPTALVIHDIDTTLGEWEQNTGTVNHQQLLAELMSYADKASHLRYGGRATPVFVTANDLGKLYAPLRRSQRISVFQWLPTHEERTRVVEALLGSSSEGIAARIVDQFPEQSIAFFSEGIGRHREDLYMRRNLSATVTDMRQVIGMRWTHSIETGDATIDDWLATFEQLDIERKRAAVNYVNGGKAQ